MERRTKTRKLTAAEGEKYRRMREEIEQEKPEIARRARALAIAATVTARNNPPNT